MADASEVLNKRVVYEIADMAKVIVRKNIVYKVADKKELLFDLYVPQRTKLYTKFM